jgi:hypothetical protein
MIWSTRGPTKSGWYWYSGPWRTIPTPVWVGEYDGKLCVVIGLPEPMDSDSWVLRGALWGDRIPAPAKPEKSTTLKGSDE